MGSRIIPVSPFVITVFGATGDLARRKLYPALWQRLRAGQAPESFRLIGASRTALSEESFRRLVGESLPPPADEREGAMRAKWLARARYFQLDASAAGGDGGDDADWAMYAQTVRDAAAESVPSPQVFYFALAPNLAGDLCGRLKSCGVLSAQARLVLEKPFGWDLDTARRLNAIARDTVPERQIYRIDHYLGKETVQNLMALRFANALFEPVWNARMIDHIQITVAEQIGVGRRGEYYDRVGATRDMLQNHLLQLLCLMAMEAPNRYEADSIRDEKLKVLHSLRPLTAATMTETVATGQYVGYAAEVGGGVGGGGVGMGVATGGSGGTHARAETFVAVKCAIDNWRWAGTPFYLRTGKRLSARASEIVATFKSPPHNIFPTLPDLAGNALAVRLQPQEGMKLHLNIKEPGLGGFRLSPAALDMSLRDLPQAPSLPDAYERLLMDVVRGDQTLFMRNDEVEAAWQWVAPLLDHTEKTTPQLYEAGSDGPAAAAELLQQDKRQWRAISER